MYLVIRLRRPVLLVIMAVMITGCVSTVGYAFMTSYLLSDTILSGVKVASVDVGGLSCREASVYLSGYLNEILTAPITIAYGSMQWEFIPSEIGITTDLESIMVAAFQVGRQGNLLRKLADHYQSQTQGWNIPHIVSVDQEKLSGVLRKIAVTANSPPLDARIVLTENDEIEIIPSYPGQKVDMSLLTKEVIVAATRPSSRRVMIKPQSIEADFSTEDAYGLRIQRLSLIHI